MKLPITEYNTLLNQSINIGCLNAGGGFEFQSQDDKDASFRKQADEMKQFKEQIKSREI